MTKWVRDKGKYDSKLMFRRQKGQPESLEEFSYPPILDICRRNARNRARLRNKGSANPIDRRMEGCATRKGGVNARKRVSRESTTLSGGWSRRLTQSVSECPMTEGGTPLKR